MNSEIKLPITNTYKDVKFIPSKKEAKFVTLITMYDTVEPYHLDEFLMYNDDTDVYIISDNRQWSEPGTWNNYGHLNNDILLREWWQKNKDKISLKKLLYVEYDVLITIKITNEMFTDGVRTADVFHFPTMKAKPSETWSEEPWWWATHGDRLPVDLKCTPASGFATVLFLDTSVLDLIILPKWDDVFQQDIISEIRLPTLFYYYKVPMYNWDKTLGFSRITHLPLDVKTEDPETLQKIKTSYPGFYHPIKTSKASFLKDYKPVI